MEDCKGLPERVGKLEVKVDNHEDLLRAQLEKNEALVRISLLMEQQQEDSRKRDERMEKFSETLTMVNENLTTLNSKQELLGNRVNDIETTLNNQKLDVVQIVKKVFAYGGTLLGGLVAGYLYMKFGIK